MTEIAKSESLIPVRDTEDYKALTSVLQNSLYPGADQNSVSLVVEYCRQAKLDPMLKPCHIVPMWDSKAKKMRDTVMPGIGLYRIQAARTGCAGITEPEFGPLITKNLDGTEVTFPEWAKVTVSRLLPNGQIATFTAIEFWLENYATAKDTTAPNKMWKKRVYGQIAKCAEAQALRKGFPEIGAAPTAEEMEGKTIDIDADGEPIPPAAPTIATPKSKSEAAKPEHQPATIEGSATVIPERDGPPADGKAGHAEPAPAQNRPISAGALNLIRSTAAKAGKGTELELCKQFLIAGDSFEGCTEAQYKAVMAYLKAA